MLALFGSTTVMYLARVIAFLTIIPIHELAHAYISDKLGDHTARRMGRLTLNPLKHIDPWGFLAMLVIGVGWAKPVPVDPDFYKNKKVGMAITAVAGPASNFILGYLTFLLFKVFSYLTAGSPTATYLYISGQYNLGQVSTAFSTASWTIVVATVLYYLTVINVTLGLFNLIPIPPLDGSRVLGLILPEKFYFGIQKYEKYVMIVLLAAIFALPYVLGFSPLSWFLGTLSGGVMQGYDWATGFVDMLMG